MPLRFGAPQDPKDPELAPQVDTTKRYDVYSARYNGQAVVYRNVLFIGSRNLYSCGDFDMLAQFLELEHPNGARVFISRHGIFSFCEHGKTMGAEWLTRPPS